MAYRDLEKQREYKRKWAQNKRNGVHESISLRSEVSFPQIKLPDHIKPTKYAHYYVSNDGIAYREPRPIDMSGKFGKVNEYGLIELTTHLRGNPNHGEEFMYEGVNIYFYDETGKNIGYKKRNIHQLVAETWIPNPHGYTEVLHGSKGNRCNHVSNLRWGTHSENMRESSNALPEGTQRRTHGKDGSLYEKKDGEWVLVPSNKPAWNKGKKYKISDYNPDYIPWNKGKTFSIPSRQLPEGTIKTRSNGSQYKKENGKWVYVQKTEYKKRKTLPDGTIRTRSDGTVWMKENGKWIYQKKIPPV